MVGGLLGFDPILTGHPLCVSQRTSDEAPEASFHDHRPVSIRRNAELSVAAVNRARHTEVAGVGLERHLITAAD
jgi:hypothetical protein